MSKVYTPRHTSTRWLEGAPRYILDVFDDREPGDRYTVVFDKSMSSMTGTIADTWISYLGMSGSPEHPQGVSMWGEMEAYKMADYRRRNGRHRIRWADLPDDIRAHVVARAEATEGEA